jgi:hypothetical protein
MRFPEFFESAWANVPAHNEFDDDRTLAGDWGDRGPPFPAPWFTDPWEPSDDAEVTTIEIPDGVPDSDGPPIDLEAQDWGESGYPENGAEAVAFYVPWHSSPQQWGIYFLERPFFAFVTQIATIAGLPPDMERCLSSRGW